MLIILEDVPPVVDELEVAPVDGGFCRAWASAINCCEADSAAAPFAGVVAEVPDVELVVAGMFGAAVVAEFAAGGVLVGVWVDVTFVVPIDVLVDVMLPGTADKKSTVIFAPPTFALLDLDTTVVVGDELDAAAVASNSV